jgi:hypothetical protein
MVGADLSANDGDRIRPAGFPLRWRQLDRPLSVGLPMNGATVRLSDASIRLAFLCFFRPSAPAISMSASRRNRSTNRRSFGN